MRNDLVIPREFLPADGRFGCGPSRVTDAQVAALQAAQPGLLGTSHRQAPVKQVVQQIREGLAELFRLPDGYEVILGNGGASAFWDAAAFGLVENKAQHSAFGEFGTSFAKATSAAPFLADSSLRIADAGSVILPEAEEGVDLYAWPHNETSTGAAVPVVRPEGIGSALTVVDGTSAAGGIDLDITETDAYYFSPQKSFAADGGLWLATVSPAAVERIEAIAGSGRYIPSFLSLKHALDNSRANQTLNTPALATLIMLNVQVQWMLNNGGLAGAAARSTASSRHIYEWAEARSFTTPFVSDAQYRSPVVTTIDLDESVNSEELRAVLKRNGIVDVDPYRKLGRNQLRIGVFPAVPLEDVQKLTAAIDWVVEQD